MILCRDSNQNKNSVWHSQTLFLSYVVLLDGAGLYTLGDGADVTVAYAILELFPHGLEQLGIVDDVDRSTCHGLTCVQHTLVCKRCNIGCGVLPGVTGNTVAVCCDVEVDGGAAPADVTNVGGSG